MFFDRDGTLIDDEHYLADPARVRLRPGAAAAVRSVAAAGLAPIVVTNQSGIGRGLFGEADYEAVRARVGRAAGRGGRNARRELSLPARARRATPGAGMRLPQAGPRALRQAAAEHGIDLARSVAIGDRRRDLTPLTTLGGYGVLVPSPDTPLTDMVWAREAHAFASTLTAGVARALAWVSAGASGASAVEFDRE